MKMSKNVRVLVVDDSAYNRQTIKAMLQEDESIEVVGVASDGVDAISKTLRLKPDLITLDFEMPEMDGFSFLRWLMHERPTPVIMISSYSHKNMAIKALELGALDFIAKPTRRASDELKTISRDLRTKVHAVMGTNMQIVARNLSMLAEDKDEPAPETFVSLYDIVSIGSSTGGPAALQIILTHLPSDLPVPVLISQHMPKGFTASLAGRLDRLCSLPVVEASDGDVLESSKVYICPGGYHMTLKRMRGGRFKLSLLDGSAEDKYIPSVDKMMHSAVDAFGSRVFGIILTGMGNDGAEGMVRVSSKGGYTVAESEETAIVYGMPKEVVNAGAATKVLPLDKIASEIRGVLLGERRR